MTATDLSERRWPAAGNLSVEVHDGHDLAGADWPSITAAGDLRMHVYQSREFLDVWMNTIARARRIECYLVVVRDGAGAAVLRLPLAIETKFNVRLLRFMDAGVADYNAPILASSHELTRPEFDRLWAGVLSSLPRFDAVDLEKIAGDVMGARNPLTYLDCAPYASSGHSIRLDALAGEVNARPSVKRLRQNLHRHLRALSGTGVVSFIVNPDAGEADHVFDRLIELKRRKYMRTLGRDFLAAPGIARFYREMTRPARIGGVGHLSALTWNGEVVSGHFGFYGRGRLSYALPAYDTQFARFRAGHLLLQHLIDQAVECHLDTFDLGVGDFSYKEKWATHRLPLYGYERAVTAAGRLYLEMRRARRFVGSTAVRKWLRAAS